VRRIYGGFPVNAETRDRIDQLIKEVKQWSSDIFTYQSPELKNKIKDKPFYVYRGGRAPLINSCEDIFTVEPPFIYTCTSFLSTSCIYDVGRKFCENSEESNIIWKLQVQTCTFAYLGELGMHQSKYEKEFLFLPGQRIEITSISRNEDGYCTINGILLNEIDPLPSFIPTIYQNGGVVTSDTDDAGKYDMYLPKNERNIRADKNSVRYKIPFPMDESITRDKEALAVSVIIRENENRRGTRESPYFLVL
jgi:hypothetical protein